MSEIIPTQLCPACGYPQDRVTGLTPYDNTPVEGSITICIDCGTVSQFDDKLKLVSFPDWLKHVSHQQAVDITQTIGLIRHRGRIRREEKPS